ncbi:leucyl/phenylalanyl-tRNA--protein transferase [Rhodanobacter caeni]|uniref:Leucyl/phenylalanyl-tRNA--protein transferase n=1 Tax=Rhodanobacter caeni TaxID=657654 RepID=A0ABN0U9W3_9GAMM
MIRLPLLDPDAPTSFPDPGQALTEPNGLLAFGGDLSPARLLAAYGKGIFPWFSDGEPILWWSPDPRCVLRTQDLHIGRSLRRQLAGKHWHLTLDHAFDAVVRGCAAPRRDASGTWIVPAMIDAYNRLYHLGHAHSLEVWEGGQLIGGIYGIALGQLFCGESMFSRQSGASKLALVALARLLHDWGFPLIDTQVANAHTLSLGAVEIPRAQYLQDVATLRRLPGQPGNWAPFTDALIQPCAPL